MSVWEPNIPVPSREPDGADRCLQVYLLGSVPFEQALALQRRLVYQVSGDPDSATLILCEHPPLITVGRQGSRMHIRYEPEELQARQWPVRWVNRGGGCWLHLPGQFAIYPVLALDRIGLGLQRYMDRLQEVIGAVLNDFTVMAKPRIGQVGLWVGPRPIATIGVAVRGWVTYYGAALNINPDLEPYRKMCCTPGCDTAMTSLERERRGPLRTSFVRERLIEYFAARFGFERTSLFFDHPSLPRKVTPDAVASHS
jgi:lipoyl(octanoyl) transferase